MAPNASRLQGNSQDISAMVLDLIRFAHGAVSFHIYHVMASFYTIVDTVIQMNQL